MVEPGSSEIEVPILQTEETDSKQKEGLNARTPQSHKDMPEKMCSPQAETATAGLKISSKKTKELWTN
jgi:hypothetical protein